MQARSDADLTVYLVDDGSSDGTPAAVRAQFPEVHILPGTGQLFWSGGMRLAQLAAEPSNPDYLLWLNDDVRLDADAVATLVATHSSVSSRGAPDSIIVAAMRDPETGATTYSGVVRRDRVRRMRFTLLEPAHEPVPCETMNGNAVLVPRSVYRRVGLFDSRFTHAMNDYDYGLRAQSLACEVWLAPGHLGTCVFSRPSTHRLDDSVPFRQRLRYLVSPLGLPPKDWLHFTRRHGGLLWPGLFISPYIRFLVRAAVPRRTANGATEDVVDEAGSGALTRRSSCLGSPASPTTRSDR
jgi:GT2 family glycosyltransferase